MLSMINKKRSSATTAGRNPSMQTLGRIANKKMRQENAYNHLLEVRKQNTGRSLNSDIVEIVKTFNDSYVTRSSMNHMIQKEKKRLSEIRNAAIVVPEQVTPTEVLPVLVNTPTHSVTSVVMNNMTVFSDVTSSDTVDTEVTTDIDDTSTNNETAHQPKKLQKPDATTVQHCTTLAAARYRDVRKIARENHTQ
jgi:hypothetical protein